MRLVPHPTLRSDGDPADVSGSTGAALAAALGRSVRTPVEALRIVLEDVARGTAGDGALDAAIETLVRLRRTVQAVEDYYRPATTRPLRCTPGEIIGDVRRSLTGPARSRLLVAVESAPAGLVVDGPLLVRSIVRLVENALEAGSGPVMLHVSGPRSADTACSFSIVGRGSEPFDLGEMSRPFRSERRGQLGLGLTLALRDVERIGGHLSVDAHPDGTTRFRVELDRACAAVEAA
jgi:signal transduction histidine kinase